MRGNSMRQASKVGTDPANNATCSMHHSVLVPLGGSSALQHCTEAAYGPKARGPSKRAPSHTQQLPPADDSLRHMNMYTSGERYRPVAG